MTAVLICGRHNWSVILSLSEENCHVAPVCSCLLRIRERLTAAQLCSAALRHGQIKPGKNEEKVLTHCKQLGNGAPGIEVNSIVK